MTQEEAKPSFVVGERVGPYTLGAAFEASPRQMSCFMTTGPQGQPALFWGLDPIEDAERRRERTEALRFLAYLRDPGLSPILDTGVCPDGRRLFLVTERPTREPLRPFDPEERGAMRPASALRFMISLLETVEFLQEQGVTVMSAMRPELLHVTPDPRCVMLGWFEDHLMLNSDGPVEGEPLRRFASPPYLAPEVIFGPSAGEILPSSPVFVAGVVMVELLRGQHTFSRDRSVMSILMEMHDLGLESALDDMHLPPGPRRMLGRALAFDASDRTATVGELLGELRECLKNTTRPDPDRQYWEVDGWGEAGWYERGPYVLANPKGSMYVERGELAGNHGDGGGDGASGDSGEEGRSWVGRLWDRFRGR